jgi:pimeloyl-ACP methyl ester carboxylesterase
MPANPNLESSVVESEVQLRIYPGTSPVTLIYLPGLHGDWTLIGSFRKALAGRMRFVEITYPRTLVWSLDDYAANIEAALLRHGITDGWVLAESFGSQVGWALAQCRSFQTRGIILAGGFVRHPAMWLVRFAEVIGGSIPLRMITAALFGYARIARFRFRHAPEVAAGFEEFLERRTELDRRAAVHRLRLIFRNDPRAAICAMDIPLYAITGWLDPIVPWFCVRRWLRRHCAALRDYRIVRGDHNVLGTAPKIAVDVITDWIARAEGGAGDLKGPKQKPG